MVRVNCNQKTFPSKDKQTFLFSAGLEWYVWICACVYVCTQFKIDDVPGFVKT